MFYLFVKHKVVDFVKWKKVFDANADGAKVAGLHLLYLLRDTSDPNLVVLLFKVDDIKKGKAFTETPDASKSKVDSGVIGVPEMMFLSVR
jgi:hypothetical protein